MPYRIVDFETTPNPNALKCNLDREIASKTLSFRQAADGADHPLAGPIFAIPGVCGVMFCRDFVTVSRESGRPWGPIRAGVEAALDSMDDVDPEPDA